MRIPLCILSSLLFCIPSFARLIPIKVHEKGVDHFGEIELADPGRVLFSTDNRMNWIRRKFAVSDQARNRAWKMVNNVAESGGVTPVIPRMHGTKTVYVRAESLGHLRVKEDNQAKEGWVLEGLFGYQKMLYIPPSTSGTSRYSFEPSFKRVWVDLEKVRDAAEPDDVLVSASDGQPTAARIIARGQDDHDYLMLYSELISRTSADDGLQVLRMPRLWIYESEVPLNPDLMPAMPNLSEPLSVFSVGRVMPGQTRAWGGIFDSAYDYVLQKLGMSLPAQCGPIVTKRIPYLK